MYETLTTFFSLFVDPTSSLLSDTVLDGFFLFLFIYFYLPTVSPFRELIGFVGEFNLKV